MTGLTRYILKQLLVGMIFVSAALACVLWLTQSLRLIEMIVSKGLSVGTFLTLTSYLMPSFLSIILPVSIFAVTLFTYNKMINDRELVVMRTAGLNNWALARPSLILAGGTMILGYVLSLWLIPVTVREFREMQWTIRNDLSSVLLQEGTFNKFGTGLTIYVRDRSSSGELFGILVHDSRSPDRPVTLLAERGALLQTEAGPRVLMINGSRHEVAPRTGNFSLLYFDSYSVEFAGSGDGPGVRFRDARERSLAELIDATPEELGSNDYRRAKVELHQRLSAPLYTLGFAMIALAGLLGASFDRRGQTTHVLAAVGVMVAAQAAALGIANLATANLAFVPAMYFNALLTIAGAGAVITRPPRWSRLFRPPAAPAA